MKIEDQVCSLKLSKRLKELGVKQESLFIWGEYAHMAKINEDGYSEIIGKKHELILNDPIIDKNKYLETWSAFTVAELGEMLPESVENPDEDDQIIPLICAKNDYGWELSYSHSYFHILCKTEADARARMLIFLLETGIIQNG